MNEVGVTLISGRTSQQGAGLEVGKTSDQYFESVALLELSPADAEALGLEEGAPVEVATRYGSIVVQGRVSKGLEPGLAFFPYGPWANQLFGSGTGGTGMPSFKGIGATVRQAPGKKVPTLMEIVEKLRGDH